MEKILSKWMLQQVVSVYVDDIIIHTNDRVEHQRVVAEIIDHLTEVGIRIQASKCVFMTKTVLVLGHIIGNDLIMMDPHKGDIVGKWPRPKTRQEVQRFLGFVNYLRKYIPNYAQLAAPLEKLRNAKPFYLEVPEEEAFNSL